VLKLNFGDELKITNDNQWNQKRQSQLTLPFYGKYLLWVYSQVFCSTHANPVRPRPASSIIEPFAQPEDQATIDVKIVLRAE
jgi:hypothetical protein